MLTLNYQRGYNWSQKPLKPNVRKVDLIHLHIPRSVKSHILLMLNLLNSRFLHQIVPIWKYQRILHDDVIVIHCNPHEIPGNSLMKSCSIPEFGDVWLQSPVIGSWMLYSQPRYIGGGRRHWDGSGGSNGALEHFEEEAPGGPHHYQ